MDGNPRRLIGFLAFLSGAAALVGIARFHLLIRDVGRYDHLIRASSLPVGSAPFILMITTAAVLGGFGMLLLGMQFLLPKIPRSVRTIGLIMILLVTAMVAIVLLSFALY